MADPAIPACLTSPYSSKPVRRGGTVIAEDVVDLDEHRHWVSSVDGYRLDRCEDCLCDVLHGHGQRVRTLRMGDWTLQESIRRYRCTGCRGIWQVLPAVIARGLHRTWGVAQSAVEGSTSKVPKRTVRRWLVRLGLSALVVVQALGVVVADGSLELDSTWTRHELVEALATAGAVEREHRFAQVAEWIHRVAPGVRLM